MTQSFPKHDGLFHVAKSALRSLLRAITDQPHFYEKHGSNNMWHLPSPIVACVMKVVLILPFEVFHMVFGARGGVIGCEKMWKGGREREQHKKTNKNMGWKMSPQWNPQPTRQRFSVHPYCVSLASGKELVSLMTKRNVTVSHKSLYCYDTDTGTIKLTRRTQRELHRLIRFIPISPLPDLLIWKPICAIQKLFIYKYYRCII